MATTTQTIASPHTSTLQTSNIHRGPVTAKLNFYKAPEDGSKPFNYVETPPEGHPQRNFSDIDIPITISDIRGHEASYSLDTNAFAALTNIPPSSEHDFLSDASVKQNYYPEVEALLLAHVPTPSASSSSTTPSAAPPPPPPAPPSPASTSTRPLPPPAPASSTTSLRPKPPPC